jgi:hypothetical protein
MSSAGAFGGVSFGLSRRRDRLSNPNPVGEGDGPTGRRVIPAVFFRLGFVFLEMSGCGDCCLRALGAGGGESEGESAPFEKMRCRTASYSASRSVNDFCCEPDGEDVREVSVGCVGLLSIRIAGANAADGKVPTVSMT